MLAALLAAVVLGNAAEPAELRKAKQLFAQGRADYQAGHFQKAIDEFLAADQIKPSPALPYNVAQAYEKLGDLGHAVEYYQDYLLRTPQASDREVVVATIRNLQAKLQAEPAVPVVTPVVVLAAPAEPPTASAPPPTGAFPPTAPAPAQSAPPPTVAPPPTALAPAQSAPAAAVTEPSKPHRSRALPIALGVIGVAAGIVALVGLAQVVSYHSTVNAQQSTYTGTYADAQGWASQANAWGDASIALGVVAIAGLTGAGLTW